MGTKNVRLALEAIQFDDQLQMRAVVSEQVVQDYRSVWEAEPKGNPFPRILAYFDGEYHWLADGHYRVESAKQAGRSAIDATVKDGNKRDAILAALGANEDHGVRRTWEDKRKSVSSALLDEELVKKSDQYLSKLCRVSRKLVAEMRRELEAKQAIPVVEQRECLDGKVRNSSQQKQLAVTEPSQTMTELPAQRAPSHVEEPVQGASSHVDEEEWYEVGESHEGNGHAGNGKPKAEPQEDQAKESLKGYKKLIKHLNRMGLMERHSKCLTAIRASIEEYQA
jgi:ParB-like chromosome segregation protein Spo0J